MDRREIHSEYSSDQYLQSLQMHWPHTCPQEAKYQKHLHLETCFCHCSTWRSYKCSVCVSSTGIVIDALFNHLSATGEMWNSTIKVCRRIYSQKCFRNWVEIQQPAGIIKYFLAAKGYSEDKKARQQHRIQKPNPYRRWNQELQWHDILKQLWV